MNRVSVDPQGLCQFFDRPIFGPDRLSEFHRIQYEHNRQYYKMTNYISQ